jgi:mRNA interferase HigB
MQRSPQAFAPQRTKVGKDETNATKWRNLTDTRQTFAHADPVGQCTVFNIKGNDYSLITRIDYGLQTVTLKHFLSHAEYDRGSWKNDC